MRDYNLKLDILDSEINIDELWFIKDDVGGYITLELRDNEEFIDLSNSSVIAIFEKKDKTITQKQVTVIDPKNSIVKLDMLNSIIDIPGKVKCFIKIYEGENVVTFLPFSITVKKSISMDDVIESYTELDILQIVNRNKDNIENLTTNLNELSDEINKEFENVNDSILSNEENFNNDIELVKNAVTELSKNTNESVKNLDKDISLINENLNTMGKNIKDVQDHKANIIISAEEPDTTNLSLGTIWIKPMVQDE